MVYCSKCGAPVEGKFCAKCGSAVGAAPGVAPGDVPPAPTAPVAANPGLGMDENQAAALCYIPIVGLIFLLVEPYNKNKTIRFHAFQSIFIWVGIMVVSIGVNVVFGTILGGPHTYWLMDLIWTAFGLGILALWLSLMYRAYNRERWMLPVAFKFLGIGHIPNATMFKGQIDLDADGYIKTEHNVMVTRNGVQLHGVYACGDVQDRRYRQAITAAGTGCMAALEVEKYLEGMGR